MPTRKLATALFLMLVAATEAHAIEICPPVPICPRQDPQAAVGHSAPHGDHAAWCHAFYAHPRFAAMTPEGRAHKIALCAAERWRRETR